MHQVHLQTPKKLWINPGYNKSIIKKCGEQTTDNKKEEIKRDNLRLDSQLLLKFLLFYGLSILLTTCTKISLKNLKLFILNAK